MALCASTTGTFHPAQPLYSGFLYVKGVSPAIFGGHSWKRQFTTLSEDGRIAFSTSPHDRVSNDSTIGLAGCSIRVVPHVKYDHYFVIHPPGPGIPRAFRAASAFALADLLGRIAECRAAGPASGCMLDSGDLLRDDGAIALLSPRTKAAIRDWCVRGASGGADGHAAPIGETPVASPRRPSTSSQFSLPDASVASAADRAVAADAGRESPTSEQQEQAVESAHKAMFVGRSHSTEAAPMPLAALDH